ncbi:MAG TPA: secondary thiamine-phosphate synthase enzyme YjbQ [Bacteroidales bacterium]|nr:secondary thiamine-phosphate synthase enzyme YjbQ [Bacteroidales bacterium]HPS18466.1 secondary thiamine-phosphate synthase enzyme YjbQ [Bacteroidales bacterium]
MQQIEILLPAFNRGYHLITDIILKHLPELPTTGLLNIFIQHTSAGITINENFDSSVRKDFESFFNKLIPDGSPYFIHDSEGDDDMPAHLKTSIIGQSLTIPITNRKLNLGTWQGIYLCEFRNNGGKRKLVISIYS